MELPQAIEPFLTDDAEWSDPGVYCLALSGPHNDWRDMWEVEPPWWEQATTANRVFYVGASQDVLSRLEDHRDGAVRQATITQVCDIDGLQTVEFHADPYHHEYNLAAQVRREHPDAYVHCR